MKTLAQTLRYTLALLMVLAFANIVLASHDGLRKPDSTKVDTEENLSVEQWMLNEHYIMHDSKQLEGWMMDNTYFVGDKALEIELWMTAPTLKDEVMPLEFWMFEKTEKDRALEIEPWMMVAPLTNDNTLDIELWMLHIIDNRQETALQIEQWMLLPADR